MSARIHLPLLLALIVAAALALPAAAGAVTYCVDDPDCTGSNASDLQAALSAANSNGTVDEIQIGPGTYEGPFSYASGEAVTISGAGIGETVLTGPANSHTTFGVNSTNAEVRDLTVEVAQETGGRGIATNGSVSRVEVNQVGAWTSMTGIEASGNATITDSRVNVISGTALSHKMEAGQVTVTGSELESQTGQGVFATYPIEVRSTRISAASVGVNLAAPSTLTNSVVHTIGSGSGVIVGTGGDVTIDHTTLVADAGNQHGGVSADTSGSETGPARVEVTNSIITGYARAVRRFGNPGEPADIHVAYSSLGPGLTSQDNGGEGSTTIDPTVNTTTTPLFADRSGGDFHLMGASSLVDAGTPFDPVVTDLEGSPRPVDGDASGGLNGARSDLGAYEYQRRAPTLAADLPAAVAPGESVVLDASGTSDPDPGDELIFSWDLGDGRKVGGPAPTVSWPAAGTRTVTLTVVDSVGEAVSLTREVNVTAAPDKTAPVISGLRLSRRTLTARGPGITTLRFGLTEAAKVRLVFEHRRGGRLVRAGRFVRAGKAGQNALRFRGRVTRGSQTRRLAPGAYRVTVTATDFAGNRSAGKTRRLRILG